ncbi:hypothetical protein AGLY_008711 [Aphis glycines]|uniref:Uncharacterized protein n=1 Tax=Aphis glycines TaxID=307491 RepID=A0A6G0TK85_APHGL|nr:hypothetical protein AGLY_008711 [Aphis glycines]
MVITRTRTHNDIDIKINGHQVTPKKYMKYLGVNIDSGWRFTEHAKIIAAKAGKVVQRLSRIMPNISAAKPTKRKLNQTIFYEKPTMDTDDDDFIDIEYIKSNHFRMLVAFIIKEYVAFTKKKNIKDVNAVEVTTFLKTTVRPTLLDCIFDIIFGKKGKKNSRSTVDYWIRKVSPINKVLYEKKYKKTSYVKKFQYPNYKLIYENRIEIDYENKTENYLFQPSEYTVNTIKKILQSSGANNPKDGIKPIKKKTPKPMKHRRQPFPCHYSSTENSTSSESDDCRSHDDESLNSTASSITTNNYKYQVTSDLENAVNETNTNSNENSDDRLKSTAVSIKINHNECAGTTKKRKRRIIQPTD